MKPHTRIFLTSLALSLSALLLPATASADILADIRGKCPDRYQPYVKYGRTHCKSPEKPVKAEKSKSSSSSSSSGAVYEDPSLATVGKKDPHAFCPTGFYTKDDICTTDWEGAPKTRLKAGACPAGTIEEFGAYCTDKITDLSDQYLDRADGRSVRDFNALYVTILSARKPMPAHTPPAALQAALDERKAQGNPWMSAPQRDAAKNAPAQAAARKAQEAEQNAKAAHDDEQIRVMCAQVRAGGLPIGPGHTCHGVGAPTTAGATAGIGATPPTDIAGVAAGAATPAAPGTNVKDALKQGLVKGLFGNK